MLNENDFLLLTIGFLFFMIIVLLLVLYRYTFDKSYEKHYKLYVVSKYADKDKAAKLLTQLNDFGIELIDKMHKKYKNNLTSMQIINRLLHNYDPDKLEENDPIFTLGHKTFTMNFKTISMCLRKKDGTFYDFNILQFVFLHELSHVGSHEKDHGDEFWRVFKFIAVCAAEMTSYIPTDYSMTPMTYCDISVTHNPIYDSYDISNLLLSVSNTEPVNKKCNNSLFGCSLPSTFISNTDIQHRDYCTDHNNHY